jgi:hypothetical protein
VRLIAWWRGNSREDQNKFTLQVIVCFLGIVGALITAYLLHFFGLGASSSRPAAPTPKALPGRTSSPPTAGSDHSLSAAPTAPSTSPSEPATDKPSPDPVPLSMPPSDTPGLIKSVLISDDGTQGKAGRWSYAQGTASYATVKFSFQALDENGVALDKGCYTLATVTEKATGRLAAPSERNGCTDEGWDRFEMQVGSYRLTVTARTDSGSKVTIKQDFTVIP